MARACDPSAYMPTPPLLLTVMTPPDALVTVVSIVVEVAIMPLPLLTVMVPLLTAFAPAEDVPSAAMPFPLPVAVIEPVLLTVAPLACKAEPEPLKERVPWLFAVPPFSASIR